MGLGHAREYAAALAVGRVALGVSLLAAPGPLLRPWTGQPAELPAARMLARAMGGRDLALGLGALTALSRNGQSRGWVLAGAAADGADLVATVLAWPALPRAGRWVAAAAAGSGAGAAIVLAPALERSGG
ncbi:MAG: hypothetical protein ACRDN9_02865 [Streptosporangiaceae bacterium]